MEETDNLNEHLLNKTSDNKEDELIDESIRSSFIVKVYSILLFQLCIATIFILLSLYSPLYIQIVQTNVFLLIFFSCLPFICLTIMICYPDTVKKVPNNYIILIIFTVGFSYITSRVTSFYTEKSVIYSLFLTFVVVISLIFYAKFAKTDFTIYGGVLNSFLWSIFFGGIALIFYDITVLDFSIRISSILCFSGYILYDTQLLLGKKSNEYSIDDYILVALNLYVDIINLFLNILKLIGNRNN